MTMDVAAMNFGFNRGASDEHTRHGSARSEQQRVKPKGMSPEGFRFQTASIAILSQAPQERGSRSQSARTQIKQHLETSAPPLPGPLPQCNWRRGRKNGGLAMDFRIFHAPKRFCFFKRMNQPSAPWFPRPASGARGEGWSLTENGDGCCGNEFWF